MSKDEKLFMVLSIFSANSAVIAYIEKGREEAIVIFILFILSSSLFILLGKN